MLRGPLALGRLTQGRGGHQVYRPKTPKPDGTTHLVATHYHGVLAPAHPWRALIVPKKVELTTPPLRGCSPRWIKWADSTALTAGFDQQFAC